MSTEPWDKMGFGPWDPDVIVPATPPSAETREKAGLPPTLHPVAGDGIRQHPVFDPSIRDHRMGMRLSEPHFDDPARARDWFATRRAALDCVLAAITDSPWSEHLVLRGSVLLAAWCGAAAREPGDVDFIVIPQDWEFSSGRTDALFPDIARRVAAVTEQSGSPLRIRATDAVDDDIWTYDRVPGRRLVLPWTPVDSRIPTGTVQLDFVFNEALPDPPRWTEVPRLGCQGPSARLLAATPELSLAWKLLWLTDDKYPEGKDLYDAVLLAEHCTPSSALLRETGVTATFAALSRLDYDIEWEEFAKDRPDLTHHQDLYTWRLLRALAPVFATDPVNFREDLALEAGWVIDSMTHGRENSDPAIPFEDRIETWGHPTTVDRLRAIAQFYDCSPADAADRIIAARRRRTPHIPDAARVNPHEVVEKMAQWRAASTGK
ncbi:nucleotidyl transferase AbiEii/AbiGii toxin family protein [Nocardia yamanashiensis]|uniref:nucleotidyl transferase AbiEii/AbiGii toxin family protein n=1 Tax=Nocardia yamanashiensis TaxID=209247 RepID=UPI001E2BBD9D|nr:nucleotidyl transferase AbiEii/AbiGii toxin family protein [Nocardia yamanashiensis]UGT42906.1 nucleotidyl transferase AbiEii/AbiGii toxin family protein [Nocardia yamanashiensis]